MKQDDFLVEIHTEELPPKSLRKLGAAFHDQIIAGLKKADLNYGETKWFATPRRLAVLVNELDASQPNQEIERKGPAVAAAFDASGKPTPACVGFAKSCGVNVDQLARIITPQGEWLGYKQKTQGKTVQELLPTIVNQSLLALPIAKRMRWGASDTEFVRPVHSVIMLYGKNVVEAEILGHKADRITRGHRFLSTKEISIKSPKDYEAQLEQVSVIADLDRRRTNVQEQAQQLAQKELGNTSGVIFDAALLDEVASIIEKPFAFCGHFDKDFLNVPSEVLVSAMQDHQRYFPVVDGGGKLLPNFIAISNIDSKDMARVTRGNERVLRARLSDAAFFYETDKQEKLADRVERLKHVVYQAKLGTLYDKAERISKLAAYIAKKMGQSERAELAERAGLLAKADLTSGMVGEFPELQGIMGYYYAEHEGEHHEIAQAIRGHYEPRYAGEIISGAWVTVAVALADRIDSLVGAFGINQIPTGDKDPYGLRRAAIGVLRYLIENQINLDLRDVLTQAFKNYTVKLENQNTVEQVLEFINERLRAYYQENGFTPDLFAAVNAVQAADLYDVDKRIKAVQAFKQLNEAEALSAANKRVSNILKTADVQNGQINEALFEHEAEKMLAQKLQEHQKHQTSDYKDTLVKLADLRQPVDNFFDNVMVMAGGEKQENRIRLLKELRKLFLQVADIALLQNETNQAGAKKNPDK